MNRKKTLIILLIEVFIFSQIGPLGFLPESKAYADSFVQTDWSGGTSANTASHPGDQTDWNEFSAKDDNVIATGTGQFGKALLTSDQFSIKDTVYEDYQGGTTENVQISGNPGEDASVVLQGGLEDPFVDNLGKWVSLNEVPTLDWYSDYERVVHTDSKVYIYAVWDKDILGRFSVDTQEWEFLAKMPGGTGAGASLAWPGAGPNEDYIFVTQGGSRRGFWRYSISADTWTVMANVPTYVRGGGNLTATTSKVFCTAGSSALFYEYDIGSDTWTPRENIYSNWTPTRQSTLVYPGTGNYIYLNRGYNSTNFCAYHITKQRWDFFKPPNADHGISDIFYPGTGDYIYGIQYAEYGRFSRYSISSETWEELPKLPIYSQRGFLYHPGGAGTELKYISVRNYTGGSLAFDTSTSEWNFLPHPQRTTNYRGAALAYDGTDYIYRTRGSSNNYLERYSITNNEWENLANAPFGIYHGADIAYLNGYVYATRGETAVNFARYNTSANSWETLSDTPAEVYWGGALVTVGNYIYAFRGNQSPDFWKYDPSTDTWSEVANPTIGPLTFSSQTALDDMTTGGAYTGEENLMRYRVQIDSEGTPDTFRWSDDNGSTWQATDIPITGASQDLNNGITVTFGATSGHTNSTRWNFNAFNMAPDTVYYGSCLAYPGFGDYIYAARGNSSDFWKYNISTGEWITEESPGVALKTPVPFYYSAKMKYPGSGDYLYFINGYTNNGCFVRYAFQGANEGTWEWLSQPPLVAATYCLSLEAVGNNVYLLNEDSYQLHTYTISTNEWTEKLEEYASSRFGYGSVVHAGGDTVYIFTGIFGRHAWKYSVSQDRFTGTIYTPFSMSFGTRATYPGSGDYIYLIEGSYTNHLWRYDIVNRTWTQLSNAETNEATPVLFTDGSQMSSSGDIIYLIAGHDPYYTESSWNRSVFMRYTISTDSWETSLDNPPSVEALPDAVTTSSPRGNRLRYVSSENTVFWKVGRNSNSFYAYRTDLDTWQPLTNSPYYCQNGTIYYHPDIGDGDSIYYFSGSGYFKFYRYDISEDAWYELSNPPFGHYTSPYDSDMFYPGTGDFIYLTDGYNQLFARYSISQDTWDLEVGFPYVHCHTIHYSSFCEGADGNTLYSGAYHTFYRYNLTDRTWTSLTSPWNSAPNWRWDNYGAQLIYPGQGSHLYATRGRNTSNFVRYSIPANEWDVLNTPSQPFGNGHQLVSTAQRIYALRGGNTTDFWSYNPVSGSWSTATATPAATNWGASLCYPGSGDYIYATRGNGTGAFWRYSLSSSQWEALASVPALLGGNSYMASSLVYPGAGDFIYLSQGSSYEYSCPTGTVFRYSMSQNTWEALDELCPQQFDGLSRIVYPGTGDYLYALHGDYKENISKFLVFKKGSFTSTVKEVGRNQGFDIVDWNSNVAASSFELRARTSGSESMADAQDWDDIEIRHKGDDLTLSYPAIVDGQAYIQYQLRFFADDINNLPELQDIDLNYTKYPAKQTLISSPYDTSTTANRITGLSWSETQPGGSDIRFQLRTAADEASLASASWVGPGGTQGFTHDFSLDTDYAYATSIEVASGVGRLKKLYQGFDYTQRIIFDNTSGANSYTNFVATIEIDSSNKDFWEHVKSDGSDVRFSDGQGNSLGYNIHDQGATFDYAAQYARIYIKIPFMPAGEETTIYLKYGNAAAVSESDAEVFPLYADFAGTTIDSDKFEFGGGNISQDEYLSLRNDTADGWDTYLITTEVFARENNLSFIAQFKADLGTRVMVGWHDAGSGASYTDLIYCLYFNNGELRVYEDGGNRGSVGSYTPGEWYDIKITLKNPGATYYYRLSGETEWIELYNSVYSSESPLKVGISHNDRDEMSHTDNWSIGFIDDFTGGGGTGSDIPYYFTLYEEHTTSPSLSGWEYHLDIEIDNTSGIELTNYPAKIELTPSHEGFWKRCRSDGYDIRFVDSDNITILDYTRTAFSYAAKTGTLYVEVPLIPEEQTKKIYLYYGKSDASNTSNYDNTLYKDFDETGFNVSGLLLDGVDDRAAVSSATSLDATSSITLEAQVKADIDYWPEGFSYRKKLTINNSAGPAYSYMTVEFTVPYQGEMNADYSDLRFWNAEHSQKLRYKINSSNPTEAEIWLVIPEIPANANKEIYMYYGNSSASSESDNTISEYEFNVDFSGTVIDSNKFLYGGGTVSQNEFISFNNDNTGWDCYLITKDTFNRAADKYFQFKFKTDSSATAMVGLHDSGTAAGYWDLVYCLYFTGNNIYIYEDGTSRGGVGSYTPGEWYDCKIVLKNQGAIYYYKLASSPTWIQAYDSSYSSETHLRGAVSHYSMNYQTHTDDWVILRTTISPSVNFGSQETETSTLKWLPGFSYRKIITLDNTGGSKYTNILGQFDVSFESGKMNADYSDLRFLDTDGTRLDHRITESSPTEATILVKIPVFPQNSTKKILMYYGNPNATFESESALSAYDGGIIQATGTNINVSLIGFTNPRVFASEQLPSDTYRSGGTATQNPFITNVSSSGFDLKLIESPSAGDDLIIPQNVAYLIFEEGIHTIGNMTVEVGTLEISGSGYQTVYTTTYFTSPPVVLAATQTDNNSLPMFTRVRNVGNNSFQVQIETTEDSNPTIANAETVAYAVISVETDTEAKIEAYRSGDEVDENFDRFNFSFTRNDVGVVAHMQSEDAGDPGYAIVRNTTSQDVEVAIEEPSPFDGTRGNETIGWVAFSPNTGVSFPTNFATEENQPAINDTIIGKSGAYELKFNEQGLSGLINGSNVISVLDAYQFGQLMHIAFTYDGANAKIFVDGLEKESVESIGTINTNSNNLIIGQGIKGFIDEARVWNMANSQALINEYKQRYLTGNESGLVCYLPFNENSGTDALDLTSNNNDAILENGAGWIDNPLSYTNGASSALYHMDEGGGFSSADSSGNNNHITLSGLNWDLEDLTGFPSGNSLEFDGVTSYAYRVDSPSLDTTKRISIEAWIKPSDNVSTQTLVVKGNDAAPRYNYRLLQDGNNISFIFYNGEEYNFTPSSGFISAGNTYHIVATYDQEEGLVKIYSNGQLRYSSECTVNMLPNDDNLQIGKEISGAFAYYGLIDDVRIYRRALSPEEILHHYQHRSHYVNAPLELNIYEVEGTQDIAAYAVNNPVIQPVFGVFYENSRIADFQEIANIPHNTGIKYQISADGYRWYWWDGDSWEEVELGYDNANLAATVNSNISSFQDLYPSGDFYYRVYLHTEPGTFMTPSLDNIMVTLLTGETFYIDPSGSISINSLHSDASSDRWVQYKAILYSDGEETPLLDDITIEYIEARIDITYPNGGEDLNVGQDVEVTWTSQGIDGATGLVKIEYSADGGSIYQTVEENVDDDGSYTWEIPDDPAQNALIKISSEDFPTVSDTSNDTFRILSLEVTSPNGGEIWEEGKTHNILWSAPGSIPGNVVKIDFSTDGGGNWTSIVNPTPNDSEHPWGIPSDTESETVLVQISNSNNPEITDTSDAVFHIVPTPEITITSPQGGEEWTLGTEHAISWEANQLQFSDEVILEYSKDNFASDVHTIAQVSIGTPQGANPNDDIVGSHPWNLPDDPSATVRVRIREVDIPVGRDTQFTVSKISEEFSIMEPSIAITSPVSSTETIWVVGDTNDITWETEGNVSDNLYIEYSTDDGQNWNEIATGEDNDATYSWNIPAQASENNVLVKISDLDRPSVSDTKTVKILSEPEITVTYPNGGETFTIGTFETITWISYGNILESGGADYNKINIYYSDDNGQNWVLAAYNIANSKSHSWEVADAETTQALIKVEDENNTSYSDTSDAIFSISIPTITIEFPNGGEAFYATGSYDITWSTVGAVSDNLTLQYSTNGGGSWTDIDAGVDDTGSYTWLSVTDSITSNALIRMIDADRPSVIDVSDAPFSIIEPTITVTTPNGGEEWAEGTVHEVSWTSMGYDFGAIRDNLTLQYSSNGGSNWTDISTGEANDGYYTWTIPGAISTDCYVQIFDATRQATQDETDEAFSITLPFVEVLKPNGGESWIIGTTHQIEWRTVGAVSDDLQIEYSKDNFSTSDIIFDGVIAQPNYEWTIPDDFSATVKVRITDNTESLITDDSDAVFSIVNPVLTVTAPNGGELWTVGDTENITWTNTGSVGDDLLIEYSKDNFASNIITIAANLTPNNGNHPWQLPIDPTATARVRITDNTRPAVWDKSNAGFTILPIPQLQILTPNGSEVWRVGSEEDITWSDNGGLVSNNLTLEYSTNAGSDWTEIATGVSNGGLYAWGIPDQVSASCLVRITDASRPSNTDESDDIFQIADPLITITSPDSSTVWAVDDRASIIWTTEGTVSDNLVLQYSPDGGANYYTAISADTGLEAIGVPNSGSFNWLVADYITSNAKFKIIDGNRPATVGLSSGVFKIIAIPRFVITSPAGGESYVLENTLNITWTCEGLDISDNLLIESSNNNFVSSQVIISGEANDGNYSWSIPQNSLTGSTMKVRITDGSRTEVTGASPGYFTIKGGFELITPNGAEIWVAKSAHTVTWQTRGNIDSAKLEYTLDDGLNWNLISASVDANLNSYTWTLPDIVSDTVKLRISNAVDFNASIPDTSENDFRIVYVPVHFKVLDFDTMSHLDDLEVTEPATSWHDTGLISPDNLIREIPGYAYATYTTFFSKTNYIDNSVTWSPPKEYVGIITPYVITCYLENTASAQVSWEAILTYSFAPATDTLAAVGSLQRKGKLVGTRPEERESMGAATLTIYEPDGETVRNTLTAFQPNDSGFYTFTLANTTFAAGYVYPATLSIFYRDQSYTSSANIDVGSEILQYEFFTQTATKLASSVEQIKDAVAIGLGQTKQDIENDIASSAASIKSHTSSILSTVEESLTQTVEEAKDVAETAMKSEILNRENTVKSGEELVIRYRTYSGLVPSIDLYDAENAQQIVKGTMAEIGTTGIYEYLVKFDTKWGRGDFTIVCSEAIKGTLDALIMTVISSDIDSIAGQVASIMGTTSSLDDFKGVAETMTAQFAVVESALASISRDIVNQVTSAVESTTNLDSVYSQLVNMSKDIRSIGATQDINLEKLYEVNKEKKQDITYLRNKTQELKAAMELNVKMMDNIANKPVTQTWFEFK
ncbi:MAG: DUF2341 domain-containing protein [Candidatus Omnitrophica bacterium]|nr:DUF2341 domain-containing protein [Candidatus Omnitrophota bacterium]